MAVTDVLLTLAVTGTLALLVSGRVEWAGVVAGLAASAKYPGAVLVAPLVVASWGHWQRLARALGLAAVAFVATSPFVIVHAGAAWHDIDRVRRLAQDGWLGFEDDPPTPVAFADRTWDTIGPLALVAVLGLVVAIRRSEQSDRILLAFAVVYGASLLPVAAHFDRYVLPLVPLLAVLAGRRAVLVPLALVTATVPLWWSIEDARSLTGREPRLAAATWIDRTIPRGERIAADPATLPLEDRDVVRLELPGPGRPADPRRRLSSLRANGVRWLVVGGVVTDRVVRAAEHYPREAAFYQSLERLTPAFSTTTEPGRRERPWLRVYRL
jgi:hypothetical protein